MADLKFRTVLTGAIKYWEPRRIVFNVILLGILFYHIQAQGEWQVFGKRGFNVTCILFAVMANVLYSLAYIPDMILRYSLLSERTKRVASLVIFLLGLIIAAFFTDFVADELVRSYNW